MAKHIVCPWWLGYALIAPLRRVWQDPRRILAPFVLEGMTVLEPGPGMGFFTLELARLVGEAGRVIAVDVQPKMLSALARRARKAGLSERIALRQATEQGMGIEEFAGQVDFVLVFAVVHELPDVDEFFREAATALKKGGTLLLAEPKGHVDAESWSKTLQAAHQYGLRDEKKLTITRSHAVLLLKDL